MENTAPNSTRNRNRSYWKGKATFLQRIIDLTRISLDEARADYDNVEAELKALLTPQQSAAAHEILLSLTHHDLALLADEYRAKYLALQAGASQCH